MRAFQRSPRTLGLFLAAFCALLAHPCSAASPAAPAPEPGNPTRGATTALAPSLSLPVGSSSLPDAPEPNLADASIPELAVATTKSATVAPTSALSSQQRDAACQADTLHGKPCRSHWLPILWQTFEITAAENAGNIALDEETRHDLVTNPYWATYVKCVHQFRYRQWRDDDDFLVDYVGHGMQGAIAADIFEQNSPTGRGLIYVNNGNYWRSRLKGMAWTTVYEVQWKIGPAGEASIGNSGLNTYFTPRVHGRSTNETGFQDFVDTPIVGFWWNVGEDAIDRFVMPHIWAHTHNKWALAAYSVLTPCKSAANLLRYKAIYYRDFPITPLHSQAKD